MNIKNRLAKLENRISDPSVLCECPENALATSTMAYLHPERCRQCGRVVRPRTLIVADLAEVENFNFPVKIYAGFNPALV